MIQESKRLGHIQEYYFSKKLGEVKSRIQAGQPIINLGIGNPDLSPSKEVITALQDIAILPDVHGYQSYNGDDDLREAISNWTKEIYQVDINAETEILPLLGSKEGINFIYQAFVNEDDEVLVPDPGYPTYRSVAKLVGANVKSYNSKLDAQEIQSLVTNKTKVIWLNYPHMPTGEQPDKTELQKVIEIAKRYDILVVNDNPYSTILNDDYFSIFQLKGSKKVCLELNSLSKTFNMAGWRVGWCSGKSELIKSLLKVKSNYDSGMFLPVQKAAVVALKSPLTWYVEMNKIYRERRQRVFQIAELLDCTFNKDASGMFVWMKIPENKNSLEFVEYILNEFHLFVAPGDIFGEHGKGFIRFSLCNSEEQISIVLNRIKSKLELC